MAPDQTLRTYADLAELYERRGQPKHRDWFLVLAADAALSADQPAESDRLLERLLSVNPHHFLKPFGSFAEALRSPDVQGYVGNLKRNYPPDKAGQLLEAEQKKHGGGENPETPARSAAKPAAPGPFAAPREEPEVIFARFRSVTQEDAEVHFEPEPEPEPRPAPPPPRAAPPPRAPAPLPRPRPMTRPVEAEKPAPEEPPPEPKPGRTAVPAPRPETPAEMSPIIPTGLFLLLLLLGLGLGIYALLRPFLPEGLLP